MSISANHKQRIAENSESRSSLSIEIMDTSFTENISGVSFATGEKLSIISQLDSMGIAFTELHSEDCKLLSSYKWSRSKPVVYLSNEGPNECPMGVENVAVRASCLPYDLVSLPERERRLPASFDSPGSFDEENLAKVKKTISALKKSAKNVFLEVQHFFDGFYENSDYALTLLEVASKAGASRLVLCDSRGATLPAQVETATKFAARYLAGHEVILGIHARNDSGLAVSNTLLAISAGARHVQGSVNGIGERTGTADLCQILPLLVLKLGYNALNSVKPKQKQLEGLKTLSESVARVSGLSIPNQPFVGQRAFSHSEPSHCEIASKNPTLYEPLDPKFVGNTRSFGVGYISTVLSEISQLGLYSRAPAEVAKNVLKRMNELESLGYKFSDSLASIHLLILDAMGTKIEPFSILGWETSTVRKSDNDGDTGTRKVRATIRLIVQHASSSGSSVSASSEGVGPIHAIDLAIKKALSEEFPEIKHVKLVSYSLNIVDSLGGTAASARARTEFVDEDPPLGSSSFAGLKPVWATVSVSDDVIDASIRALVEGYKYKLIFLNRRERFALPDWRLAMA